MTFLDGDSLTDPSAAATTADADIAQRHADANAALREIRDEMLPDKSTLVDGDTFKWEAASDRMVRVASGTYANIYDIWLFSDDLQATFGSPVIGTASGYPLWLMDASSTELVAGTMAPPSDDWSTFNVYLWWANNGTGTGDVAWQLRHRTVGVGEVLNGATETTESTVTATAGAQHEVVKTQLASGITAEAAQLLVFNIRRLGGNAGDTLADDAGILAAQFTST